MFSSLLLCSLVSCLCGCVRLRGRAVARQELGRWIGDWNRDKPIPNRADRTLSGGRNVVGLSAGSGSGSGH